mgnify:CR=1 FL=1
MSHLIAHSKHLVHVFYLCVYRALSGNKRKIYASVEI